jgi:hypothetical protein
MEKTSGILSFYLDSFGMTRCRVFLARATRLTTRVTRALKNMSRGAYLLVQYHT